MYRLSYYNRFGYKYDMEDPRMPQQTGPAAPPGRATRRRSRPAASHPRRCRRRPECRWGQPVQERFLWALGLTRRVDAAAFAVERTVAEAHAERQRNPFFAARWDLIMDPRRKELEDAMLDRVLHGIREPILVDGEEKRVRIRYSDSLGMLMLRTLMPEKYGAVPRAAAASVRGTDAAGRREDEVAGPGTPADEDAAAERLLAEIAARLEAIDAPEPPQQAGVRPARGCPDPA